MDTRAWRLAAGAGTAVLVLVALVSWRADSLAGGWLLALRLTGLLAVAGLLAAVVLGCLAALRPPTAAEVLVRVSATGEPQTTSRPGRRALVPLAAVLLLAVLSAAPVLVVLVLATGPREAPVRTGSDEAGGASSGEPQPSSSVSSSVSSSQPVTTTAPSPSQAPSSPSSPSSPSQSPSAADPSGGPSSSPAPSSGPSRLPSDAGAPAVCYQVVADGDSLWSIAQRQLGPGATAADLDARWRALYARNTAAVGPDPDLIHPGLALHTCA